MPNNKTSESVPINTNEVSPPVFSAESGFYNEPFDLALTTKPGYSIYYSLDCSEPSKNSTVYKSPIHIYDKSPESNQYRNIQNVCYKYKSKPPIGTAPVEKCFIIRAIAVDKNGRQSKPITHSYFINKPKYEKNNIISIVTDPDNLFGNNGIYTVGENYDAWYQKQTACPNDNSDKPPMPNFEKRGKGWERPCNIELMKKNKVLLNQPAGLRINGGASRSHILKPFCITARKKYNKRKWFDHRIFDIPSHSLIIRRDFYNALSPSLVNNRNIGTYEAIPVTVFVDGEYWYDAFLLEKYSKLYFAKRYNLNAKNISILKNNYPEDLKAIIAAGHLDETSVYVKLSNVVDISSLIDFWCTNIYLDNEDILQGSRGIFKNHAMWKTMEAENDGNGDGRWRWMLYDMDLIHGWKKAIKGNASDYQRKQWDITAKINTFVISAMSTNDMAYTGSAFDDQPLFSAIKNNPVFCKQFVLTFMDFVNYCFRIERVAEKMAKLGRYVSHDSYFFQERPKYIVPYVAEEFNLSGTTGTVTLSSNLPGSILKLNTIFPKLTAANIISSTDTESNKPSMCFSWRGYYFTDYPITVSTDRTDFICWEITTNEQTTVRTESTVEVPVQKSGVKIYAKFGRIRKK